MKVCRQPNCPTLIEASAYKGRCPQCNRDAGAARGTTTEQGYGAEYEKAKRDPAYVEATHCLTCGDPFTDDNPKTGGHVVALRFGGGPAVEAQCRRCNYGWRKTGL